MPSRSAEPLDAQTTDLDDVLRAAPDPRRPEAPQPKRVDDRLGTFALRPVDAVADAPLLHGWLTHPKSVFWQLGHATVEQIRAEFSAIADATDREALLGLYEGRPLFLMERYDPRTELGDHYPAQAGDIGMHFLVAPAEGPPIHGLTTSVLTTIMDSLFADPSVRRIVVEPDVRNTQVQVLNAAVGFGVLKTITLPTKQAALSICTRAGYQAARGGRR
ncbi:GNAT family N-acetyltransferase [Actinoalloteichus hymeniacidonis]|uniref:Lysine N-acyltransferase MbtK n=1 Tax=Actinoalloteichus hymeniacidonis TaxID=340345 RepID=A0AAC9N083_9PSEU|nr:GNAT family N-acetyltransferase [Actinoalloteichus hymeniacidonis]AOS65279.1 acetyltransferase, ribosomal protein N-acetylase [Actinoalloteichus hymeniacidonis]MBB5906637.1 RimJ/RimL family protein N-acetyltransferase [Actinoalloteichus hymeniacidonis]